MFICRHVLLRAYIPRLLPPSHVSRRLLAGSSSVLLPEIYDLVPAASAPPDGKGGAETVKKGVETRHASVNGITASQTGERAKYDMSQFSDTPALPAETKRHAEPSRAENPLATYVRYRKKRSFWSKDFRFTFFLNVLETAAKERRMDIIASLVEDVMAKGHHLGHKLHLETVREILLLSQKGLLQKRQIISLLTFLRSLDGLYTMPADTKISISAASLTLPPTYPAADCELADIIASLLIDMLVDSRSACTPEILEESSQAVELLYLLACNLAMMDMRAQSLKVMAVLVQTNNLHPAAIRSTDLASGDFGFIVLSALVRSSVQRNWRANVRQLLLREVSQNVITPPLAELSVYALRSLLREPSFRDLSASAAIIIALIERSPEYSIPPAVLQDFYTAAQRLRKSQLAECVYRASRDLCAQGAHSYPPPQDGALTWLLQQLLMHSKSFHAARQLATQVVDDNIPIPVHDRGRFIALVASQGLAMQARALWERYANGEDREVVVGNSMAMLRLVSLFTSLSRRGKAVGSKVDPLFSGSADFDVVEMAATFSKTSDEKDNGPHVPRRASLRTTSPAPSSADFVSEESAQDDHDPMASTLEALLTTTKYLSKDSSIAEPSVVVNELASHAHHTSGDTKHAAPSAEYGIARISNSDLSSSIQTQPRADGTGDPSTEAQAEKSGRKMKNFRAFAELVYAAFLKSRRPLREAHHFELNALARASFMLGKLERGVDAFKLMIKRRILPDLRDVNVALSILAEYNPTGAAQVIERMAKAGLQMDAVTFGIAIHHAIVHRDMPLVTSLVHKAQELNCDLSYKTIGTLIRSTITMYDDGRVSPREHLDEAKTLIDLLLDAKQIPSPKMGMDCIIAALRADDPVMAYNFWDLLVKDKTEWEDAFQTRMRRDIARKIRKHHKAGRLRGHRARVMLLALDQPLEGRAPASRPSKTDEGGSAR